MNIILKSVVLLFAGIGFISSCVALEYLFEKWLWNNGKCRCGGAYGFEELSEPRKERIYRCVSCERSITIKYLVDV